MKLKIEQIADRGVPNLERLHLRVLEQTNLSYHVVLSSYYIGEAIYNGGHAGFWFPSIEVKPGDNVIVYTRSGVYEAPKDSLIPIERNFFFYWGLPQTLWNNMDACAVVLDLIGWQTSAKGAPAQAPSLKRPLGDLFNPTGKSAF